MGLKATWHGRTCMTMSRAHGRTLATNSLMCWRRGWQRRQQYHIWKLTILMRAKSNLDWPSAGLRSQRKMQRQRCPRSFGAEAQDNHWYAESCTSGWRKQVIGFALSERTVGTASAVTSRRCALREGLGSGLALASRSHGGDLHLEESFMWAHVFHTTPTPCPGAHSARCGLARPAEQRLRHVLEEAR